LGVVVLVAAAVAGFGFVVMSLWNWLMPSLFGWRVIDFAEALGLLVLSRVLFGGWRGGRGHGGRWRERMIERWQGMTPEEREKFVQGMDCRLGRWSGRPAEPKGE
jgi:hypothetical protein